MCVTSSCISLVIVCRILLLLLLFIWVVTINLLSEVSEPFCWVSSWQAVVHSPRLHFYCFPLRDFLHLFDVYTDALLYGSYVHTLISDGRFLAREARLIARHRLQVEFLIGMEVLTWVLLDVFVELALGEVINVATMLHGDLVNEVGPMGNFRSLILSDVPVDSGDGRVSTEGFLHIFTRLFLRDLIVIHDLLVDFESDLLKVFVLYLVKIVELLLCELINH